MKPAFSSRSTGIAPKIREAGSLLLADCAQSAGKYAASRRRFHRAVGAQARRPARGRRAAGQGPRHAGAASAGRRRAIAAGRRMRRARWPSPRRLRPGPMTWSGWRASRAKLDEGVKAAGGVVIGEDSPRLADDRRGCPAGRVERSAAGPVRPCRHRGFRRKRLLVGQDEGERACSRRWASRPTIAGGFLRVSFGPHDERGRGRRLPRRMAADRRARQRGGMIYLDYQATTPVAPEVAAAMRPWIEEKFANPH